MQKVFFKIFGCKVNQLEIEAMRESYIAQNHKIADALEDANVVIIGSCTVTHTAESKLVKFARKALRTHDEMQVKIVGCWLPEMQSRLAEYADRIEFINNSAKFEQMHTFIPDVTRLSEKTRAFIKIQEGCNSFCSYCIIPYMRSQLKSRSIADTVAEVQKNLEAGAKEIVLVGIHLGLWREKEYRLHNLVEALTKIDGDWRLRLTSVEIHEITSELINLVAENNKLVEHLHIPLQAGSTQVLKRMNRNYTKEFFLDKISQLRAKLPKVGISTDIIVGFPGETDEDFADTLEIVEKTQFMRVHAFPFSARSGTKAFVFKNKVHPGTIKHRENELFQLAEKCKQDFTNKFINSDVEILTEKHEDGATIGYTREYLPARITTLRNPELNKFYTLTVKDINEQDELIL